MARSKSIKKKTKSKGLGDTVAKVFSAVGIKECRPCSKRKARLNSWMPYYNEDKGKMTEEQYNEWKEYEVPKVIKDKDMDFILANYNCIFHTNITPCRTCGASTWNAYIKRINKVFESYDK